MTRRAAATLALAIALAACGGAGGSIALDGAWPPAPGDYAEVTEAWTRRGEDRDGFTLILAATATLKSPAWRSAYVAQRAGDGGAHGELLAEEKKADQEAIEVELLFATQDPRANDLSKGKRSIWRVRLVAADGREVAPIEILRDRRPRSEIAAYFPSIGDFDRAYVLRFPRTAAVFGPGARRVALRLTSGQAAVELVWQAH